MKQINFCLGIMLATSLAHAKELTPFLVKAVQDLKQRNDNLTTENDVLKTRLERLEKLLGIVEQRMQ